MIIISWLGDGQKMCNFKLHNAHKKEQTDFLYSAITKFSGYKFLGCQKMYKKLKGIKN